MVARVNTVAFHGITVLDVDVQVQMAAGLPAFTVVGLPDKAVAESRERVRAALAAMGLALPPKRITVNLSPADLIKEGSHFDLPIGLGLLAAMGVLPTDEIAGYTALGELALDGALTAVAGVLPAAIHASAGERGLICPAAQGGEAAWAGDIPILAAASLLALVNHFKGVQVLSPPAAKLAEDDAAYPDLADIKGQETAKRALEIAAAGGHNLLMVGPPGAGKSMLAARLPGLLPHRTRRLMVIVKWAAHHALSAGARERYAIAVKYLGKRRVFLHRPKINPGRRHTPAPARDCRGAALSSDWRAVRKSALSLSLLKKARQASLVEQAMPPA